MNYNHVIFSYMVVFVHVTILYLTILILATKTINFCVLWLISACNLNIAIIIITCNNIRVNIIINVILYDEKIFTIEWIIIPVYLTPQHKNVGHVNKKTNPNGTWIQWKGAQCSSMCPIFKKMGAGQLKWTRNFDCDWFVRLNYWIKVMLGHMLLSNACNKILQAEIKLNVHYIILKRYTSLHMVCRVKACVEIVYLYTCLHHVFLHMPTPCIFTHAYTVYICVDRISLCIV